MSLQQTLLKIALLGTERQTQAPQGNTALQPYLAQLYPQGQVPTDSSRETAFLGAAALALQYCAAGSLPAVFTGTLATPDDKPDFPLLPPASEMHLRRMLADSNLRPLLNGWLERVAAKGLRVPTTLRIGLRQLLLEPEVLQAVEADIHLVATLISLKNVIPGKTKDTARQVVAKVVEELLSRLQQPMQQAVKGALNRAVRNRHPRLQEIDWNRTIRANIKNYLPEYNTIVPDKLIGYGCKRSALKEVVLCIDQSGSIAPSVVYSSIFAAVMASMPALRTKMVVFDTAIVDLTDELHDDPVDLLFGLQLGGGTDINRAVGYCQGLMTKVRHSTTMTWRRNLRRWVFRPLPALLTGSEGRDCDATRATLRLPLNPVLHDGYGIRPQYPHDFNLIPQGFQCPANGFILLMPAHVQEKKVFPVGGAGWAGFDTGHINPVFCQRFQQVVE
jgi:hypothetical protein